METPFVLLRTVLAGGKGGGFEHGEWSGEIWEGWKGQRVEDGWRWGGIGTWMSKAGGFRRGKGWSDRAQAKGNKGINLYKLI